MLGHLFSAAELLRLRDGGRARDSDGKRDFADRARLATLDLWT